MSAFEDLGVMPELIRAVEDMGWTRPTAVQAEAIPLILGGGDVAVVAETGSGKTGAFCLPIIQLAVEILAEKEQRHRQGRSRSRAHSNDFAPPAHGTGHDDTREKWTLSAADKDEWASVSREGGRCVASSSEATQWAGSRARAGVSHGQFYFEATLLRGTMRVGVSTRAGSLALGTDNAGWGFGATGVKVHAGKYDKYGTPYEVGDTVGVCVSIEDAVTAKSKSSVARFGFTRNSADLGEAFVVAGRGVGKLFYPTVCVKDGSAAVNFGHAPFKFAIPDGFIPLVDASPAQRNPVAQKPFYLDGKLINPADIRLPSIVILEPFPELVRQIEDEIAKFSVHCTSPRVSTCGVNASSNTQANKEAMRKLSLGVDIVVGTPARVLELATSGRLSLENVRFFVLDEADRIVNAGDTDTLLRLHGLLPKFPRPQVLLASATLAVDSVRRVMNRITRFPTWVDTTGNQGKDGIVPANVQHTVLRILSSMPQGIRLEGSEITCKTDGVHFNDDLTDPSTPEALSERTKRAKAVQLVRLLQFIRPSQAIVFVRMKTEAETLASFVNEVAALGGFGAAPAITTAALYRGVDVDKTMQRFKNGEIGYLFCSDVVARGLDVKGLPLVINFNVPSETATYVHRIGRTGRGGVKGFAVTLVATCPLKLWFHKPPCKGTADCRNTELTTKGGCCIWYDEQEQLAAIERYIQSPVAELNPTTFTCEVPACADTTAKAPADAQEPNDSTLIPPSLLADTCRELARLEFESGRCFLRWQTRQWR